MSFSKCIYHFSVLTVLSLSLGLSSAAQTNNSSKWGLNDTLIVPAIVYEGESMPYKELEMVWVSNMSQKQLAKYLEEWNRLRNAVYVTYPYARIAGATINDINARLTIVSKKERKDYIKTREKELRTQFTEPLENLSVYQGNVLMKLINCQTWMNFYNL